MNLLQQEIHSDNQDLNKSPIELSEADAKKEIELTLAKALNKVKAMSAKPETRENILKVIMDLSQDAQRELEKIDARHETSDTTKLLKSFGDKIETYLKN